MVSVSGRACVCKSGQKPTSPGPHGAVLYILVPGSDAVSSSKRACKAVVLARCSATEQVVRPLRLEVRPQNGKLERLYQKVHWNQQGLAKQHQVLGALSPEQLAKLYQHVNYNQQGLAEFVKSLTLEFEASGEQIATCTLTFSKLHNKNHDEQDSRSSKLCIMSGTNMFLPNPMHTSILFLAPA